jgi:hypothetical protein
MYVARVEFSDKEIQLEPMTQPRDAIQEPMVRIDVSAARSVPRDLARRQQARFGSEANARRTAPRMIQIDSIQTASICIIGTAT